MHNLAGLPQPQRLGLLPWTEAAIWRAEPEVAQGLLVHGWWREWSACVEGGSGAPENGNSKHCTHLKTRGDLSTAGTSQARHNADVAPTTSELMHHSYKTRQTQHELEVLRDNCSQSDQTGKYFS